MTPSPLERLKAFIDEKGLTQPAVAELLGCDQGTVSKILAGKRGVSISIGSAIEAATKRWKGGCIKATDWAGYKPQKSRAA